MTAENAPRSSFGVTALQSLQHLTAETQLVAKVKNAGVDGAKGIGSKTYQQQASSIGRRSGKAAGPRSDRNATGRRPSSAPHVA